MIHLLNYPLFLCIGPRMITPIKFSLEEALEYIKDDELVEVTPLSIRMRKINLKEHERKRSAKNA